MDHPHSSGFSPCVNLNLQMPCDDLFTLTMSLLPNLRLHSPTHPPTHPLVFPLTLQSPRPSRGGATSDEYESPSLSPPPTVCHHRRASVSFK